MEVMKCNICRKKIEANSRCKRISDGIVCQQCWEKAELGIFAHLNLNKYTVASIKEAIKAVNHKKTEANKAKQVVKKEEVKPSKSLLSKPVTLEIIDKMNGVEFENYVKQLLEKMKYSSVQTTATIGDQGVDLIAEKAKCKYAIQCKRYQGSVGNKAVQEVFSGASFYKCDKCIVVTNSYFTNSAKQLAKTINVELWDRDTLKEMIEKYGKKIKF